MKDNDVVNYEETEDTEDTVNTLQTVDTVEMERLSEQRWDSTKEKQLKDM